MSDLYQGLDFYDLESSYTADERALRNRARAWVTERYLPVIAQHYRDGTFPFELVPELAALHAFGGTLPAGEGGAGLSHTAYGLLVQELERGDSGLRTMSSVQGALCMRAIHSFGSDEQKQQWLPVLGQGEQLGCFGLTEPSHGSNPGGMTTTAVPCAGGYRLDGQKMWIGNANVAGVAIIWAKLVDEIDVVATNHASDPQADPDAIRGFLVDTRLPGYFTELLDGKLSMRAAATCRVTLKDCVVPASALLPKALGLKAPLKCLNHARFSIAWGVMGAAMACFDEARRYALEREQFGRPIAAFQLVQEKLARMLTLITRGQLLAWQLARLADAGRVTPAQISLAKRDNVEAAIEVARTARELLGGVGILDHHQCFRHMCNLESVKTYEGTQDMHTLVLGREITGIAAFA